MEISHSPISSKKQTSNISKNERRTCKREIWKLDELEQYDRRKNLKFHGFSFYHFKDNEDVTHITLDLVNKFGVVQMKRDISIAHRLLQRQRLGRTRSSKTVKHPAIIICFLSR